MDLGNASTSGERVRISDISGVANGELDPDLVAAITIAVLEAWPKPSAAIGPEAPNVAWRFSQRRWRARPVPRQNWGR